MYYTVVGAVLSTLLQQRPRCARSGQRRAPVGEREPHDRCVVEHIVREGNRGEDHDPSEKMQGANFVLRQLLGGNLSDSSNKSDVQRQADQSQLQCQAQIIIVRLGTVVELVGETAIVAPDLRKRTEAVAQERPAGDNRDRFAYK